MKAEHQGYRTAPETNLRYTKDSHWEMLGIVPVVSGMLRIVPDVSEMLELEWFSDCNVDR